MVRRGSKEQQGPIQTVDDFELLNSFFPTFNDIYGINGLESIIKEEGLGRASRIINILDRYTSIKNPDGILPPSIALAVLLRSANSSEILNPENIDVTNPSIIELQIEEERNAKIKNIYTTIIKDKQSQGGQDNNSRIIELLYSLGLTLSTEFWRNKSEEHLLYLGGLLTPSIYKGSNKEYFEEAFSNIDIDQREITALEGILSFNDEQRLPQKFKKLILPIIDIEEVFSSEQIEENDIEGLVIRAAEVIENVKSKMATYNKGSETGLNPELWRNSELLVSYFGPILEFLGFDDLAGLAYTVGYEYIYSDTDEIDEAKSICVQAHNYWQCNSQSILSGLINTGLNIEGNSRVKGVGSTVRKIIGSNDEEEKDINKGNKRKRRKKIFSPDAIGIRLVFEDCENPEKYLKALTKAISQTVIAINKSSRGQFSLGDIREDEEAPIQIFITDNPKYREISKLQSIVVNGVRVKVQVKNRGTGYVSTHLVFNKGDSVGMEVQLLSDKEVFTNNSFAGHFFYKTKRMLGIYGKLERSIERERDAIRKRKLISERNSLKAILLGYITGIRERIHRFTFQQGQENEEYKYWLSDNTIALLTEIFEDRKNPNSSIILNLIQGMRISVNRYHEI